MIASAIEKGYVRRMDGLLQASPYGQSVYNLLEGLAGENGFDNVLDSLSREIHRVEIPAQYVEDELLVTAIFKLFEREVAQQHEVFPLVQRGQTLWVAGEKKFVEKALRGLTLSPGNLYQLLYSDDVYSAILSRLPAPGSTQIDSIKFILVSEDIARQVAAGLMLRRSARQLVERHNLSADEISRIITGRGLGVAARLRVLEDRVSYCLVGCAATRFYCDWRYTPEKLFEIAVPPSEWHKVYAYLKNPRTFVSQSLPSSRDFERYDEIVILHDRPNTEDLPMREIDGLRVLAPEALLAELIEASEEAAILDAVALVVAQRRSLDWPAATRRLSSLKLVRPSGSLFEAINAEANTEIVPVSVIHTLFSTVSVTPDERPYPFPLHPAPSAGKIARKIARSETITGETPTPNQAIAARWGIEWRLSDLMIRKLLSDIGLIHA